MKLLSSVCAAATLLAAAVAGAAAAEAASSPLGGDAAGAGAGAAAAEAPLGFVLGAKDLDSDAFVAGRNLTIKYTFHNIGEGSAYDLHMTDDVFTGENFKLIEGSFDIDVDEILPRGNKTVRVVVVPQGPGEYKDEPAHFSYKRSDDGNEKKAQTSAVGTFKVVTEEEYHAKYADHTWQWSGVGIVAALATLVPIRFSQYLGEQAAGDKSKAA